MAKMFCLILSILALFTVVQSHNPLVAQIIVDKYINTHSFLKDVNSNEIIDSIILNHSIIGTGFNLYQTDQAYIEQSKSLTAIRLENLQENYQSLVSTDNLVNNIQQVSSDSCNASKILPLPVQQFKNLISRYLLTDFIEEAMKEDFVKIRDHLSNITPPKVTDIASLKEHVNLYIVTCAAESYIEIICELSERIGNNRRVIRQWVIALRIIFVLPLIYILLKDFIAYR